MMNSVVPGLKGRRPMTALRACWRLARVLVHGLHGLVELLGIESPGLTASLAIGEQVAAALGDALH